MAEAAYLYYFRGAIINNKNMKQKLITAAFAAATIVVYTGCKDLKPNAPLEEAMKDSMRLVIPTPYKAIRIDEHQDVTITLGSKKLLNSSEEKQEEIVELLAKMSVHFFEENNYLDEGKVIFVPYETPSELNAAKSDDPKKEYEFDFKDYIKEK